MGGGVTDEDPIHAYLDDALAKHHVPIEQRKRAWEMFNAMRDRRMGAAYEYDFVREKIIPKARGEC